MYRVNYHAHKSLQLWLACLCSSEEYFQYMTVLEVTCLEKQHIELAQLVVALLAVVAVAVGSFVAVVRKFQMVDRNLFRNTDFVAVPFKNPSLFSFLNIC
ncbi:hypothetical protein protein [Bacillus cereus G9241]|nr:hypothetical protein protein [Bacillus cereus G9241]